MNGNGDWKKGFEAPPDDNPTPRPEEEPAGEWEAPPEPASAAALEGQAGEADSQLTQVYQQICRHLESSAQQTAKVTALAEDAHEGAGNVQGVGMGMGEDGAPGGEPGAHCINLYVAEPCSVGEARRVLANSMGVSAAADNDLPINVVVTGIIDAQPHRFRIRPAPGGVSLGHVDITAGTLGCLSTGRQAPRNRRLLILSNNHVQANSNNGAFGDPILQPGPADGGTGPQDRIAILERFVPIDFAGGANFVDCATGWAWPDRVRRELVFVSGGQRRFFRISNQIRDCREGQLVGKTGRTTQVTAGRITDCNATVRVNYRGRTALFRDQIAIRGFGGDFSQGGDSGSAIWTWDAQRNPVGLLFAGGGGTTFANKIRRVLDALDINLVT